VKQPLGQRLRTLAGREHRAALFARWFPRRIDRILLAVIAVVIIAGTVLRVDVIGSNDRVSVDEGGYIANADRILEGQQIATYKWAPGTSLMFAAAAVLRGTPRISQATHSHGIAQYSQLVVEFLTLILVAVLAWILAGPWAALVAVALMATYEPLIDITRTYLSEPLGALILIATAASICWARKRDLHSLVLAGIVAGLAGLVREDYAVAVAVIMLGLVISGYPSRRAAVGRALLYGLVALAVVTPYVVYASIKEQRFTPIVSAGPHAFFLGTYLPGGGNQFIDVSVTAKTVCRHFRKTDPGYCHLPPGDAQGLFALVQSEHPGDSDQAAAQAAAFHNLDKYMLGEPLKFAHMLWNKAWNMWSFPWSGGNSVGGGGLARTTSLFQHQLYSALAWIGMLLGLVLLRRRWAFVVPVLAMLAIAVLNTFFAITPRDNVRFMPFVFIYGAVGAITALRLLAKRLGERRARPATA
jgi:4-amino-4-deoxy-L-arabinose transferase-like glycosyltransferase